VVIMFLKLKMFKKNKVKYKILHTDVKVQIKYTFKEENTFKVLKENIAY